MVEDEVIIESFMGQPVLLGYEGPEITEEEARAADARAAEIVAEIESEETQTFGLFHKRGTHDQSSHGKWSQGGVRATGDSPAPEAIDADAEWAEKYGQQRPSGDGDCYQAAWGVMQKEGRDDDSYRLVHGVPTGQGEIEGVRFDHAWVERTDNPAHGEYGITAIDRSNGNDVSLPRPVYYAIGKIREEDVRRYTRREALDAAIEHGHYGPWD